MDLSRSRTPARSGPDELVVRFWGVRGSIAVPGRTTVRYGGNTACVEVRAGQDIVILDAGTGIRELGKSLAAEFAEGSARVSILITHTHWDHIQGFPFFAPAYTAGHHIRILGGRGSKAGLRRTVAAAVETPFFPVALTQMPGSISVEELTRSEFRIGRFHGTTTPLNHPGGGVAFRLDTPFGSIGYIPDHEVPCEETLGRHSEATARQRAAHRRVQQRQCDMLAAFRDVGLLIHDAQYTASEYRERIGWGHSCVDAVVKVAAACQARRLVLFHHDPDRTDAELDVMLARARRMAAGSGTRLGVDAAAEGMEFRFRDGLPLSPRQASKMATADA